MTSIIGVLKLVPQVGGFLKDDKGALQPVVGKSDEAFVTIIFLEYGKDTAEIVAVYPDQRIGPTAL